MTKQVYVPCFETTKQRAAARMLQNVLVSVLVLPCDATNTAEALFMKKLHCNMMQNYENIKQIMSVFFYDFIGLL